MISTTLAEHASVVRALFWVAVAASAMLGWLLHRSGRQRALCVLAAVSLAGPLALTVSPSGGRASAFCAVQISVPFQGIETLANVAMLLPLTLFAALWVRRPLVVFGAVSGLSAVIELLQAFVPALGRACDTNDWFMNTVGAAIGALLAVGIIAFEARRRSTGVPAQH